MKGHIMWSFAVRTSLPYLNHNISLWWLSRRGLNSVDLEKRYTDVEKQKIIQTINESDAELISKYEISKARLKNFSQWKNSNGRIETLSDMHIIEGFSEKIAKKLFDSILNGPVEVGAKISKQIKGQILQPTLSPEVIKNCKTVLTVYTTVSSVSWVLIDREKYEVLQWKYYGIHYPETRKLQITDILEIACSITKRLPTADVYVMKAEGTSVRAAGADPGNTAQLAVNLQRAQMVAMTVALITTRHSNDFEDSNSDKKFKHKVYFLRPSLPYRLYGTLVGNERVSTDQTVDMLLSENSKKNSFTISQELINMFRSQKDLEKDMLGHCFLLSLTFMDLCIYKDQEKIAKLLKKD